VIRERPPFSLRASVGRITRAAPRRPIHTIGARSRFRRFADIELPRDYLVGFTSHQAAQNLLGA
jgi:hypothetical protein